jgi:coenzyme F420-0:L-glutamate ligase/coenzyme F420-1:gamma-L-glutamate ligase
LQETGKRMKSFSAFALENFPLIEPNDDLPKLIVDLSNSNGFRIDDGDIIVIAQKIISKAEGRIVSLKDISASQRARNVARKTGKSSRFVQLVLSETRRLRKVCREILLVEDKRGLICINAGIDKSNVQGADSYALLPDKPDRSAECIRAAICRQTGKKVGVVICDTYSRPFRRGQVNYAIGIAGVSAFRDYRGKADMFDQILKVKNIAVVDEIAGAAELLMGQATEALPVVIVRGLGESVTQESGSRTEDLLISSREDLFRNTL